MDLPRAHTHPTHRPLSHLPRLSTVQERKVRTALPSPLPLSPSKLSTARPVLSSPLVYVGNEDPFGCVDFFGGREGEWNWVKEEIVPVDPEFEEEGLDGEDVDGLDEVARRLIEREDRFGVLAIRAPTMPELTSTRTPSLLSQSPPTPPLHAHFVQPHQVDDHLPPTDEALHNGFAARSRAVSYPSLSSLSMAPAPSNSQRPPMRRVHTATKGLSDRETVRFEVQQGGELGLFFDSTGEVPVKGGWTVWALEKASQIVGLD